MTQSSVAHPPTWTWRAAARPGGPAVLIDIDGTLSDASARQHFLANDRKDWNGFFDACGDDPIIEHTAALLGVIDPAYTAVLLTARPLRVREVTVAWLARYDLRWDLLVMRRHGDFTASHDSKSRAVAELRAHGFDLRLAIDDDPRNVTMFRELGIPCVELLSGYY